LAAGRENRTINQIREKGEEKEVKRRPCPEEKARRDKRELLCLEDLDINSRWSGFFLVYLLED